jgi:hypothetical protein
LCGGFHSPRYCRHFRPKGEELVPPRPVPTIASASASAPGSSSSSSTFSADSLSPARFPPLSSIRTGLQVGSGTSTNSASSTSLPSRPAAPYAAVAAAAAGVHATTNAQDLRMANESGVGGKRKHPDDSHMTLQAPNRAPPPPEAAAAMSTNTLLQQLQALMQLITDLTARLSSMEAEMNKWKAIAMTQSAQQPTSIATTVPTPGTVTTETVQQQSLVSTPSSPTTHCLTGQTAVSRPWVDTNGVPLPNPISSHA